MGLLTFELFDLKKLMQEIYISLNTEPLKRDISLSQLEDSLQETQVEVLEDDSFKNVKIMAEFLSLQVPVIDENVEVFLDILGLDLLTRELYDTKEVVYPEGIVSEQDLEDRTVKGVKVVSVLTNDLNLEFTRKNRIKILIDVLKVFSVNSKVSTTSFKILYMYIIQKWDDATDWILQNENGWMWVFLKYVNDSNTMDCIMVTMFKYAEEKRETRQKRFMTLVEMEWMDELFRLLNQERKGISTKLI